MVKVVSFSRIMPEHTLPRFSTAKHRSCLIMARKIGRCIPYRTCLGHTGSQRSTLEPSATNTTGTMSHICLQNEWQHISLRTIRNRVASTRRCGAAVITARGHNGYWTLRHTMVDWHHMPYFRVNTSSPECLQLDNALTIQFQFMKYLAFSWNKTSKSRVIDIYIHERLWN